MTNPTHHLDAVTLVDYASGALDPALAAVATVHLMLCRRCRRDVARAESVAGAMLSGENVPASLPGAAPVVRADEPHAAMTATPAISGTAAALMPAKAWEALGLRDGQIRWRRLGPGVWHHRLSTERGDLRLMRIAAGTAVPEHGHGGTELTLVLSGAFRDVTGTYGRGDIQDVDTDVEHQPTVTPDGECICLVASETPARYKSMLGRLSHYWTGM